MAGKATVTVTGIGGYTGTKTTTFLIVPRKSAVSSVTGMRRKAVVSWKKHSGATGYQVAYSTRSTSGFKNVQRTTKSTKTITNLRSGRRYYVKVRAFKVIDGKRYYGKWSTVKRVRVK